MRPASRDTRPRRDGPDSDSERPSPIRVVIADDAYLIREALARILGGIDGIVVVRAARDLDSLRTAIRDELPEAVLTDIRMPPTNRDEGIQVARELRETHPEIGVVVLSQFADPEYILALLESGAERRGYLLKERIRNAGELVSAIEAVVYGGSFVDPRIVDVLVGARKLAARSALSDMTPRELDVLALLAQGNSNTAIAESLGITKRAVEKHIHAIFMKLGLASAGNVSHRVKAALIYLTENQYQRLG
jgi:DNA-binding NarL/FixJ family response regulator